MDNVTVDGIEQRASLSGRSLLELLRHDLDLTGPKPACGEGACGACTVLLDGAPVRACVTPASEAAGRSVTTIAGIATAERLHRLQRAFIAESAFQCGYCTPGMILSAAALLAHNDSPTSHEVRSALEGHVCRCCAYARIERAVLRAAGAGEQAGASAPGGAPARADAPSPAPIFSDFRPARPWDRTPAHEREYFELLGDGLAVVLEPAARTGYGPGSESGGAWLHVGADGVITAFTGKINMGEDNRTALSMLVAEELRVPLADVRLAMGDTDLCPSDPGTFGSRSLPDAGEDLATIAAAARELLVELAAGRLSGTTGASEAAEKLEARDGAVHGSGEALPYGELVRGLRRVASAAGGTPATAPAGRRLEGRPTLPAQGLALVTGTHRFPSDVSRPGMLHGLILRAPAYGAVLKSVDLARAREVAGVTAVHEGELVAVAGAERETAARALAAIDADWSCARQPDESELVAHLRSHPAEALGWQGPVEERSGEVERALAAADVRLEATYTTAYVAHATLETRVALAEWEGERLTVWTGTQQPFFVRYELAAALGVAEEQVRVIVPDFGGGFGSKHTEAEAVAAACLARAAGAPVRVALTREEEFRHTFVRPAAVVDVRSGARRDGTICAWEFRDLNAGSPGLWPPYAIADTHLAFQPADSPLPQGAYRALASTANNFARESHVDEIAHALGRDPFELRLQNVADDRLAEVLRAAAERVQWARTRSQAQEGYGLGIAGGIEKEGRVATCAHVLVEGGRLEILRIVTAYDCGAIVNPANVESQIEGALVMGLGGALFESVHFTDGRITNASLRDYRVPRFSDVPSIELVLVDRPEIPSAGAGETPIIAIAPAIANAVFDACGVRIRSLPLLHDGRIVDLD
ncbi:MAG: molybdopterin cofactor-binding domain-containing protein [Solirubrobacteraceae bacterium]|jgi:isoquinoline 1-oxidoreductase